MLYVDACRLWLELVIWELGTMLEVNVDLLVRVLDKALPMLLLDEVDDERFWLCVGGAEPL